MPRRLRIHLKNGFYHVTLRGNHRQPIFRADADRHLLNSIVARALARADARLHAYCWMTNHLHFLIQVTEEPLGSVMRDIAAGYARAFQEKLETTGHLFERRYHARLVDADAYLLVLLRYIHLNPVQAGLARAAGDYRWSSHCAYAGGSVESWLTTDFALGIFAPERAQAQAAYRRFIGEGDPHWLPDEKPTELESTLRLASPSLEYLRAPPRQTLESLLTEAAERFGVPMDEFMSLSRDNDVVRARGWIGREAVKRRVASLSDVARLLGRDRATLRYAMRLLEKSDTAGGKPAKSGA
jgi:REP element-mobilizing transposase RayT